MKRINFASSLRGGRSSRRSNPLADGRLLRRSLRSLLATTVVVLLAACAPVDLAAPIPTFDTGMDPNAWAQVPAGEFYFGQNEDIESTEAYEIMVTDVTVAQYVEFLNQAFADGHVKVDGDQVVGFYPGDEFHGVKHEIEINAGDWIFVPLNDPASRFTFVRADGAAFVAKTGWENHPMTNVTWFGAWGYCEYNESSLPTKIQWEKAARGTDARPFPWGWEITRENANFYASRDPFEDMSSFGSRTSPVGFYNGDAYDGFQTANSASPYGLYDMAGDVWQWIGDVTEGFSDRFMRGGSKDTYDMDLRVWVRNSAPPMYYSPGVGFRCVR